MKERGAWAEIDIDALRHNFSVIKSRITGNAKLCAVVKANAYGHGAVAVARCAVEAGAQYLAVASLNEAIALRRAGFAEPILLLGLIPSECVDTVVSENITATVCDFSAAARLSRAAVRQGRLVKLHLKIDTGMGRIGIRPEEAGELAKEIADLSDIEIEGMFSHFAAADSPDQSFTTIQLVRFRQAIANVNAFGIDIPLKHIAESSAILNIPDAHFNMVRAGIIEYGLYPSPDMPHDADLKAAMKFCAEVVFVKDVAAGDPIGYGCDFVAQRQSRIATLAVGYADGYIRAYAKKGYVEINGHRAKIVGRICMDQTMVDVTGFEDIRVGDTAVLFGSPTLTADDAASFIDTINYEVTCLVGERVPRVYLFGKDQRQ